LPPVPRSSFSPASPDRTADLAAMHSRPGQAKGGGEIMQTISEASIWGVNLLSEKSEPQTPQAPSFVGQNR
jgi:hypothetical protein